LYSGALGSSAVASTIFPVTGSAKNLSGFGPARAGVEVIETL